MNFFDIQNIAFELLNYPVSYIEFIGTLFGLISVYYASKADVLTWPTGIINELALFVLFFQIQLYADMFLQIYFFVVTLYGWRNWKQESGIITISTLTYNERRRLMVYLLSGTFGSWLIIKEIHFILPAIFTQPASYPFADSFILTASIIASVLLAKKKLETWVLWIMVDIVAVVLYYIKDIYFLSLEYTVFLIMATFGLLNWRKNLSYE